MPTVDGGGRSEVLSHRPTCGPTLDVRTGSGASEKRSKRLLTGVIAAAVAAAGPLITSELPFQSGREGAHRVD